MGTLAVMVATFGGSKIKANKLMNNKESVAGASSMVRAKCEIFHSPPGLDISLPEFFISLVFPFNVDGLFSRKNISTIRSASFPHSCPARTRSIYSFDWSEDEVIASMMN